MDLEQSLKPYREAFNQHQDQALEQLFQAAYPNLMKTARALLRNERQELEPEDLVSTVYEALLTTQRPLEHFSGFARQVMKRAICRSGRDQMRKKRGGDQPKFNLDNFLNPSSEGGVQ